MDPSNPFQQIKVEQIGNNSLECVFDSHSNVPDHLRRNPSAGAGVSADSSCGQIPLTSNTRNMFSDHNPYFSGTSDIISFAGTYNSNGAPDYSTGSNRECSLSAVVRTRRRKAGISEEERICIVCGEPASGYNFDRLTCESCKAFFRRNALKPKDKIKVCSRGGGCIIEGNQRKHCPSCRLEKCFAVGMKRELILPPEKLEQRAKPRRRKHTSSQGGSCSPQSMLTTPAGNMVPNVQQPFSYHHPLSVGPLNKDVSPMGHGLNVRHRLASPPYTGSLLVDSAVTTPDVHSSHPTGMALDPSSAMSYRFGNNTDALNTDSASIPTEKSSSNPATLADLPTERSSQHRRCKPRRAGRRARYLSASRDDATLLSEEADSELNHHVLSCLQDCVQQIREPFTPDGHLETGVAVTLEQEYNRMDACIRRIIRVVKLLPYFSDIGKPAQLSLLRANIYGLIVLYSSFFFESGIRKLNYPILQRNGQITTVTVSMLDEVVTPNNTDEFFPSSRSGKLESLSPLPNPSAPEHQHPSELREEFELYKANTLAAFDHLDQLIGNDDILRVTVLAIKLFTDDSFITDDLRASVNSAREAYLRFLWAYLRWRAGPKYLRSATEHYARLLIAFIDLRTLEIRMTEFAKLLSLDNLSPLMREVCSQRNTSGVCSVRA